MSSVEKISVALPSEMVASVRAAVESGEYSDASEVICDALRGWNLNKQVELDELRRLVREGAESGPGVEAASVFARLRQKYTAMNSSGEAK